MSPALSLEAPVKNDIPLNERLFVFVKHSRSRINHNEIEGPIKPTWWLREKKLSEKYVYTGAELLKSQLAKSFKNRVSVCNVGTKIRLSGGRRPLCLMRVCESNTSELLSVNENWQQVQTKIDAISNDIKEKCKELYAALDKQVQVRDNLVKEMSSLIIE